MKIENILQIQKSGDLNKAENLYLNLIENDKKNYKALALLGTIYCEKGFYNKSKECFDKSLEINSQYYLTLNNYALLEKKFKNFNNSLKLLDLNIKKNNFIGSWIVKIEIFIEIKDYYNGIQASKQAILIFPENSVIKNLLAICYFYYGDIENSLLIYKNFTIKNNHFSESLYNYSLILYKLENYQESLSFVNKLISFETKNLSAYILRKEIYEKIENFEKAEEDLLYLYKIYPTNFYVNKNLVTFYLSRKKYQEVIFYCEKMIKENIDIHFFLLKKIEAKMYAGLWNNIFQEIDLILNNVDLQNLEIRPLFAKYISDNSNFHKKISSYHWKRLVSNINLKIINQPVVKKKNNKIRIGYFSGDFRNHAIYHLVNDIFAFHNREEFEIYIYSSYPKKNVFKKKIIDNSDYFFEYEEFSDQRFLNLIISHKLDIAIDLSGYTDFSLSKFFNYDIAKIKINYLGYPGTLGSKKFDYIISDRVITPESHKKYYYEKIIYLPNIYQPFSLQYFDFNYSRSKFFLPENKFLIACFSRIEKILPNIFDIWMKILLKHTDVYLILNIDVEDIKININDYCVKNNFPFNRIIFLSKIEHLDNLQRMSLFDLYVDTYPYNGHTTLSDSLFQACVPSITLCGKSFASRVGKSFLTYLDLDYLVANDESEYFKLIDYYCENRYELKEIKKKLFNFKKKNFDRMKFFTKDYEKILLELNKKK